MKNAKNLEKLFRSSGFDDFKWIGGKDVVTGEWVRLKDHNTFYPTARTPQVRWIRVSLYAYWPVGTIRFDDVGVYENPNAPPYSPPRDVDLPRSKRNAGTRPDKR